MLDKTEINIEADTKISKSHNFIKEPANDRDFQVRTQQEISLLYFIHWEKISDELQQLMRHGLCVKLS